jgi:uncharacterized membrane-anchored protein YjiN (DUF445 family)
VSGYIFIHPTSLL